MTDDQTRYADALTAIRAICQATGSTGPDATMAGIEAHLSALVANGGQCHLTMSWSGGEGWRVRLYGPPGGSEDPLGEAYGKTVTNALVRLVAALAAPPQ